jgi:NADPH-dependent 2,4-dienoyl-CoA reductase/sulfur reductase-like enzyme
MKLNRRGFIAGASALAGASVFGVPAVLGQGKARVVVIGGGAGGATVAKYVARDGGEAIEVTLVEPLKEYATCFFSNLYLGGFRKYEDNVHSYDALASKYGVTIQQQMATGVDRDKREVTLADGTVLPYDRLVVSPGIELKFDSVPGYSEAAAEKMPHAWKPGAQTKLLKSMIDAVPDGGLVVMLAPPNPYRCPPGPYERVSMMAHQFKSTGRGNCKIIVIDPKDKFSKQGVFQPAWEKYYPGMIEWFSPMIHGGVKSIDPDTNQVVTDFETYKADLVNVIPAQKAGRIATDAGLANDGGYCPIEAATMKSTADPNVYVVGDACIPGDMPKSAFAANSQAKVAAMSIRAELTDARTFPARFANTCWSLIETDDCVKVGGRYEATAEKIAQTEGFVSQPTDTAAIRAQNYQESLGWYAGITADIFS